MKMKAGPSLEYLYVSIAIILVNTDSHSCYVVFMSAAILTIIVILFLFVFCL